MLTPENLTAIKERYMRINQSEYPAPANALKNVTIRSEHA